MKALLQRVFLISACMLFGIAAYATTSDQYDSSQDYNRNGDFLMDEFNYKGPHNYYSEFGVGGMDSGGFDGYTFAGRVGTHVGDQLQHGIEFEFLFAHLKTHVKELSGPSLNVTKIISGTPMTATNLVKGQGVLEEYMLMVNYRYEGQTTGKMKFLYYIGLGGGLNMMDFRTKKQRFTTIVGSTAPVDYATQTSRDFDFEPVGQIFIGGGIPLSKSLALMVRGRVLFTGQKERVKIGKLDNLQTVAKSDYYQLGAEVILSYTF